MNLIIDIGNTAAKCAIYSNDNLLKKISIANLTVQELENIFKEFSQIRKSILCSVVKHNGAIERFLKEKTQLVIFNVNTIIPITNLYKTPETLGKDRLAAAIGANSIFPNKNVLSIDVGTCIKYDFVDSNNNYHGGAISPGLSMRYKALHQFTDKLPMVSTNSSKVELIGVDTKSSIQSGVQNGAAAEVTSIVSEYSKKYEHCEFILTGGGASQLQIDLNFNIFAVPNLVLIGLNKTLKIN